MQNHAHSLAGRSRSGELVPVAWEVELLSDDRVARGQHCADLLRSGAKQIDGKAIGTALSESASIPSDLDGIPAGCRQVDASGLMIRE